MISLLAAGLCAGLLSTTNATGHPGECSLGDRVEGCFTTHNRTFGTVCVCPVIVAAPPPQE